MKLFWAMERPSDRAQLVPLKTVPILFLNLWSSLNQRALRIFRATRKFEGMLVSAVSAGADVALLLLQNYVFYLI